MLIKKVASFITKKNLISKGEHIVVALSGGRDSVCLFYILNHLKSQLKIDLSAIHINHGIRGAESDKDQDFVETYCKSAGAQCISYKLSGFNLKSSENKLRIARYEIFDNYLKENKNRKIATGHHLNDQLETYVMRLFKGSATKGMLGIPELRGKFIRPLLEASRNEIDLFCKENKINYREDRTNTSDDKLRNKIRLNLVPAIENIFGKDYTTQFLMSHKAYKNLYNENLSVNYSYFKKVSNSNKNQTEILSADFNALSKLQKAQYLEYCFSCVYGLDCRIGSEQLSQFETFVYNAQTGTKFFFINTIEVLKDRDKLIFIPVKKKREEKKKLYLNRRIKYQNCKMSLKKVTGDFSFDDNNLVENICADNIQLPLTVRSWQEGDFFYPLGTNNRQKLSDFFTNNKVSRINKKNIPIVLNNDQIVWIAGHRIDNRYKVTKKCRNILRLEMVYE